MIGRIFVHEFEATALTVASADSLRGDLTNIIEQGPAAVILDFSKLEFIDSTCFGILILYSRIINPRSMICLAGLKEFIKPLYTPNLVRQILPVYPSVEEAIGAVSAKRSKDPQPVYSRSSIQEPIRR